LRLRRFASEFWGGFRWPIDDERAVERHVVPLLMDMAMDFDHPGEVTLVDPCVCALGFDCVGPRQAPPNGGPVGVQVELASGNRSHGPDGLGLHHLVTMLPLHPFEPLHPLSRPPALHQREALEGRLLAGE